MDIRDKIKKFLSGFFDVNVITDTDNIFELGLVNSLFAMNLISFIENEFDITIENSELNLDNFKSIDAIVSIILSKTN